VLFPCVMSFSISQMASSRASLVFSLCTNTLFDDIVDDVCAASLTQLRPSRPVSDNRWPDETPRRCHFMDQVSGTSQWFDEFEPASPDTTPDSEDTESLRTVESDLDLDEQLRRSPIDSFAAMCWDATEASHPTLTDAPLSRFQAQERRLQDNLMMALPRMPKPTSSTALFLHAQAAQPCLAPVSSKAARILDLPCDMAVIPTLLDMPTIMPLRSRGATLAGRWKKAVQSLSSL